jgi:hypothetical protein
MDNNGQFKINRKSQGKGLSYPLKVVMGKLGKKGGKKKDISKKKKAK